MEQLPWRGVLVRRADSSRAAAFIKNETKSPHGPYASIYIGGQHRAVIALLREALPVLVVLAPALAVALQGMPEQDLIDRLKRGVSQYAKSGVDIRLEKIRLSDVLLINSRVKVHKYQQIEGLTHAYQSHGLPLFGPAAVIDGSGAHISVITPPVIERHGDHSVVIEGNTRALYAFHAGVNEIEALHVRGVHDTLPGNPIDLRRVLLTSRFLPSEERIKGFSHERFRNIERAVRPLV